MEVLLLFTVNRKVCLVANLNVQWVLGALDWFLRVVFLPINDNLKKTGDTCLSGIEEFRAHRERVNDCIFVTDFKDEVMRRLIDKGPRVCHCYSPAVFLWCFNLDTRATDIFEAESDFGAASDRVEAYAVGYELLLETAEVEIATVP